MYSKYGNNYSNLNYIENYNNKLKSPSENLSDLRRNGQTVIQNSYKKLQSSVDNPLNINNFDYSKIFYPVPNKLKYEFEKKIESKFFSGLNQTAPIQKINREYLNVDISKQSNSKFPLDVYKKKIGFENLGNSCYLYLNILIRNTALQCLLHSKKFIEEFLGVINKNKALSSSVFDIINDLSTKMDFSSYDLSYFLGTFEFYHKKFRGFKQHDTQEFLRILLEDISKELNTVEIIPKYKELFTQNKSKKELNFNYHKMCMERENSIIVDLFYSQICNTFSCMKCNNSTYSFEKIIDIPLLLDNLNMNNISDLLLNFFKEEIIEFNSKCIKCNNKCNHLKSSKISKLPQILIITIQRYLDRTKRKNNSKISFKTSMDIAKIIDKDCVDSFTNTKYNLFAISNHSGALDFGHYYAQCKIENNWYEFNDSKVAKINDFQNDSSSVYALFYEKNEGL